MTRSSPSRTSLGVAALRAAHQMLDAEPRILDDTVVLRVLDPRGLDHLRAAPERLQSPEARALRAHVVVRSRYAEDRLAEAAARGVRQYVSLGAGLDTFAYRQPGWASALRIFEVDRPETQGDKRERLARAGVAVPANVVFVPIDFECETIPDVLRAHGFDAAAPAFVSWLGVMMYLTREAADAVFGFVRGLPAGSEIVFTFSPSPELGTRATADGPSLQDRVAQVGEPMRTHIAPEALVAHLSGLGFSDVTLLTPDEIEVRYTGGRTDGLHPSRWTTIASARV